MTLASDPNKIVAQKNKHKNERKCCKEKRKKEHQDSKKAAVRKTVTKKTTSKEKEDKILKTNHIKWDNKQKTYWVFVQFSNGTSAESTKDQ
eukprot:172345-Ditylum_brightwellii.AAC.1